MHRRVSLRIRRAGFSLIEVLISLALTVLLLSAVYAAVGLHLRFQVAGRDQIARAQLMRSLIHKFDVDLGGVTFYLEEEQATTEETDTTTDSTTTDSTTTVDTSLTALSTESTPQPFGIVGTNELIHLCVSKPIKELTYDSLYSGSQLTGRTTELTTISWGISPVNPAFLIDPSEPAHDNKVASRLEKRPLTGLGRRVLDFYAFNSATDTLGEEHLLAPEITQMRFQYFDGVGWLDAWDSRSSGALPRAILVTYGFWQPPSAEDRLGDGTVFDVQHQFHVPMSIPIVE